jgi:hypothetical protein
MDPEKFNSVLQELIDKTNSKLLLWEKTASAGQFVASIGGKLSIVISGPPSTGLMGSIAGQQMRFLMTPYKVTLKGFSGEILIDVSISNSSEVLFQVATNPCSTRVKELYGLVSKLFGSREDKALDEALEALKKISKS